MLPELTSPDIPISFIPEYTAKQQTRFRIQQHGKALSYGNFTVFKPEQEEDIQSICKSVGATQQPPEPLIHVQGKYADLTERRSFSNASGMPLFSIYHPPLDSVWNIVLPGSLCTPIAKIAPNDNFLKDDMDVHIINPVPGSSDVVLQVRGQSVWKMRTDVYLGDAIVMSAKRTKSLSVYVPGMKVEWDVDVAEGMNIALASAIMVALGAHMYRESVRGSV